MPPTARPLSPQEALFPGSIPTARLPPAVLELGMGTEEGWRAWDDFNLQNLLVYLWDIQLSEPVGTIWMPALVTGKLATGLNIP